MNSTVISGRLVRDPGYNETQNEKGLHKIAKFVLAVRRNYSEEVSFIPVKAFAKKAEFVRDYLVQGTKVIVEGEIVTGNYENKETGKRVYTTEVYANRIEFAGAKLQERPNEPLGEEGFLNVPDSMQEELPFR
jgi:single-strand DNA-binding protein